MATQSSLKKTDLPFQIVKREHTYTLNTISPQDTLFMKGTVHNNHLRLHTRPALCFLQKADSIGAPVPPWRGHHVMLDPPLRKNGLCCGQKDSSEEEFAQETTLGGSQVAKRLTGKKKKAIKTTPHTRKLYRYGYDI